MINRNGINYVDTYRVTLGRSVMYGRFDYPTEVREEKFFFHPEENFYVGTIGFFLETGQIVDFHWDSKVGVYVDTIEEIDDEESD